MNGHNPDFRKILGKLQKFCAWRERHSEEVKQKARALGVSPSQTEKLLELLKADDFLNDSRFAASYARGKHRMNGWGRWKINYCLQQMGFDGPAIENALDALNREEYLLKLQSVLSRKKQTLIREGKDNIPLRLARYASGLGYLSDEYRPVIKAIFEEETN